MGSGGGAGVVRGLTSGEAYGAAGASSPTQSIQLLVIAFLSLYSMNVDVPELCSIE